MPVCTGGGGDGGGGLFGGVMLVSPSPPPPPQAVRIKARQTMNIGYLFKLNNILLFDILIYPSYDTGDFVEYVGYRIFSIYTNLFY
jgi:hypothetical protein